MIKLEEGDTEKCSVAWLGPIRGWAVIRRSNIREGALLFFGGMKPGSGLRCITHEVDSHRTPLLRPDPEYSIL